MGGDLTRGFEIKPSIDQQMKLLNPESASTLLPDLQRLDSDFVILLSSHLHPNFEEWVKQTTENNQTPNVFVINSTFKGDGFKVEYETIIGRHHCT